MKRSEAKKLEKLLEAREKRKSKKKNDSLSATSEGKSHVNFMSHKKVRNKD